MKKIKNLILSVVFLFSFVGLAFQGNATENEGVWKLIDQTFEDGAWQVLERCEDTGNGCPEEGQYRALTIEPE